MIEKTLTNKIIKYINSNYAETTYLYKRLGSGNESGKPDITGVHNGLRVEMEVKAAHRDKGSIENNLSVASKRQQYWIKKFSKLGAISGVVTSLNQALKLLGEN